MFEPERYREELIRLGVDKVAHQDQTLIEHLYRTCAILQQMEASDRVCLAGLFHGVYGTEALHSDEVSHIPDTRRAAVQSVVGEDVERLVFNFSVMSYESLGSSFRAILRPGGQPDLRDRRTKASLALTREEYMDVLRLKLADMLAHAPPQVGHSQLDLPVEYGSFWQIAAEYLGEAPMQTWNSIVGERLWIEPTHN